MLTPCSHFCSHLCSRVQVTGKMLESINSHSPAMPQWFLSGAIRGAQDEETGGTPPALPPSGLPLGFDAVNAVRGMAAPSAQYVPQARARAYGI